MKRNDVKMVLLLALLSAFPPLSTDMYLPALPLLQERWQESMSTINLTLAGFFIGYCVSLLVYGPLSDKYGRRRPLLTGITVYIAASLLCGVATSAESLIIFRILQGMGSAGASVLAMAITKDIYEGNRRQQILGNMATIMALAPMLAPVFGSWVLVQLSWEAIFFVQALLGIIAWIGVYRLEEPLKVPSQVSLIGTMGIYLQLIRNRKYMTFVLLFSLVVLPHFSFIGSAADIYISRFGTSEQVFGLFFAFNAMAIMAGSFTFTRVQRIIAGRQLLTAAFAGITLSGVVMFAKIFPGPWGLAIPMALASFSFGLSRPASNHIVLEQVDRHAGAASSLMIFIYFIIASFSMWFISIGWIDTIKTISILAMFSGGSVLFAWLLLQRLSSLNNTTQAAEVNE
jgi:DHA1 family bicyclomycin/chloramphenicol resistance-like MFS transporter